MSHLEHPVAVLAGTPVDTKMGADVLTAHGIVPLMYKRPERTELLSGPVPGGKAQGAAGPVDRRHGARL